MTSTVKKIIIILLVLLTATSLFSCSQQNGDTPQGMQLASIDGAPFKLYVPKNWTLNKGSGISGAYLSSSAGISVSVDYFDKGDVSLADYVTKSVEEFKNGFNKFELLGEIEDVSLDSRAAKRVRFTLVYDDVRYNFLRVYAEYSGKFIVFSYKARADFFDTYLHEAEEMLKVFKFCEPSDPNSPENDKDAPEGMKLSSRPEEKYKLYIPSSWTPNATSGSSGGYASDRSNVSFTSYSPRESMSIDGYFELCETEYKSIYENYQREGEGSTSQLAGKTARDYSFTFEYGGVKYRSRQMICIHDGMFYIMTYTATSENYEAHTEEIERILSSIVFK